MQRRGITEKSMVVLNALPEVSDAEILKRAGLDELIQSHDAHIRRTLAWTYSAGDEREYLRLEPGESQIMRESDADLMFKQLAEQGLAKYPVDADETAIEKAVADARRRAIAFFTDRGMKRVQALRKLHGLTKEEMEQNKGDYWSFFYNQAVADLLRESL